MRPVIAAGIGLVAGLTLGIVLGRGALAPTGEDAEVAVVLEAELAHEREIGEALRDRVEDLEARVAREAPDAVDPGRPRLGEPADEPARGEEPEVGRGDDPTTLAGPPGVDDPGPGGGFEDEKLLALGFHETDVDRLRRAWESLELERLYLQNERARSPGRDGRQWLKMRALENATLEELGASDYDALLYASGARNRVAVTRVFPESPAEDAGFMEHDEIIAYGDEPIFRMHVLKGQTTQCELGTNVAVTVLRDGAERRIWTPCGPLGVQLQMVSAPPR